MHTFISKVKQKFMQIFSFYICKLNVESPFFCQNVFTCSFIVNYKELQVFLPPLKIKGEKKNELS